MRERGERVRDTGQLPAARDPRAGLLPGRVGRVLAPLAERGQVTLATRHPPLPARGAATDGELLVGVQRSRF